MSPGRTCMGRGLQPDGAKREGCAQRVISPPGRPKRRLKRFLHRARVAELHQGLPATIVRALRHDPIRVRTAEAAPSLQ